VLKNYAFQVKLSLESELDRREAATQSVTDSSAFGTTTVQPISEAQPNPVAPPTVPLVSPTGLCCDTRV